MSKAELRGGLLLRFATISQRSKHLGGSVAEQELARQHGQGNRKCRALETNP